MHMTQEGLKSLPVERSTQKKLSKAGRKTSDEILAAAETLFTLKGFKATTLKEVSEISGANTALISYYFGSKEGLRDAVFQKHLKVVGSGFEILFQTPVESFTKEKFKELFQLFLKLSEKDQTMFRLVLWSMIDEGELADRMAHVIWQPFFDRLRDILVHISDQKFSPEEAEIRIWLILSNIHGYVQGHWHTANHLKTKMPRKAFFEHYESLIINNVIDNIVSQ